jgi:hypothetical protein
MEGKNQLVISQAEMVRAMELYFRDMILSPSHRGNTKVTSVRQKGAQLQKDFIIELEEKKDPRV